MFDNNGKHILLVEDEEGSRKAITSILTKAGFTVSEAVNGAEALSLYSNPDYNFDGIIVDLVLPGISGGDIIRHNYAEKKVPCMVVTGYTDSKLALRLHKLDLCDYMIKPVEESALLESIQKCIARGESKKITHALQEKYPGNVGSLEISSTLVDLGKANSWISKKLSFQMDKKQRAEFVNFIDEFMLNAYEHGSLGIGEELKNKMLNSGTFEKEMEKREKTCKSVITITTAAIKGQVAVTIADQGEGFNHKKYLEMGEVEIGNRIDMLNGRGIYMGRYYFDNVTYTDNGSTVTVVKTVS